MIRRTQVCWASHCQRCCGGEKYDLSTKYLDDLCFLDQETINKGPFVMRSTCRRCGGRGSIITTPCVVCRGTGQTKQRKTVMVPVPAGQCCVCALLSGKGAVVSYFCWANSKALARYKRQGNVKKLCCR